MHEREELTRLNQVEGSIKGRAKQFSAGDLMLVEDLAQEGREAAIRLLRAEPNRPASHLVVKAKDAISQYRRRGSSVDGKLDARSRTKHYHILSLEQLVFDNGRPREEAISDPQGPSRPTEEEACINILFASLRDSLSAEENQVLTLRLMDIPWQRVGEILDQEPREISKMRKRIATAACMVWGPPISEQEHSQDEKRAYSQTPPIPHELPANLLAILTDQERQALTAYQHGASQEVAAQRSGLSQPTVSRLLAFVWESYQQPPEAISPRTTRITRHDRREKLAALFHNRPAGELVAYEELLTLFSDVQGPWHALWAAVSRYNRQLEGAKIILVKGQGYILVEEEE
jgi:DNA-directed RNA polymerase specialized sigma subunit